MTRLVRSRGSTEFTAYWEMSLPHRLLSSWIVRVWSGGSLWLGPLATGPPLPGYWTSSASSTARQWSPRPPYRYHRQPRLSRRPLHRYHRPPRRCLRPPRRRRRPLHRRRRPLHRYHRPPRRYLRLLHRCLRRPRRCRRPPHRCHRPPRLPASQRTWVPWSATLHPVSCSPRPQAQAGRWSPTGATRTCWSSSTGRSGERSAAGSSASWQKSTT